MLRIGIVSVERHWAHQLSAIFPEWEMHVEQIEAIASILQEDFPRWDALVLDLDLLEPHTPNLVEFVQSSTGRSRHVVALIPTRLSQLQDKFSGTGVFVLRKPTSSGEIALALRMLLKPS